MRMRTWRRVVALTRGFFRSHLEFRLNAAAGRASPHDPHFFETTGTAMGGARMRALMHCLHLDFRPLGE